MPTMFPRVGLYDPHITQTESSGPFGDLPQVAMQEVTEQDADLEALTLAADSQP